jgi:hypothetical protein
MVVVEARASKQDINGSTGTDGHAGHRPVGHIHIGGASYGYFDDEDPVCGGGGGAGGSGLPGTRIPRASGVGGIGVSIAKFQVNVGGGGAGADRYSRASSQEHTGNRRRLLDAHDGGGDATNDAADGTGGGGGGGMSGDPAGGYGGAGVVMLRYLIVSGAVEEPVKPVKPGWSSAPPQTFAMGAGPHTLTVGTSAGAVRISHLRFAQGGDSCYFYTDGDANTAVCTQCPSGQEVVAPQNDISSCRVCPTETFYNEITKKCQCVAGMYKSDSDICVSCPIGTYRTSTGPDVCTECPAGTYSITLGATTAATCVACAVDTYSATMGATNSDMCLACPANTFSPSGSDELMDCKCLAGFTGSDGTECTACDVGTYKTATGQGTCTWCPLETQSAAASTLLTDCRCNTGYTASQNGVLCTACVAGSYKNTPGTGACSACPDFTSSASASSLVTDCTCDAGYTAASDGVECTACIAGTYKADTGSVSCTDCAPRTNSDEGSIECIAYFCTYGYKWNDDDVCVSCPTNVYCTNGIQTNCPTNTGSIAGSGSQEDCTCVQGYFNTDNN